MAEIELRHDETGVLTLTLARPPAHALDAGLIGALHRAVAAAAGDERVKVIVLAATGHIFCAGHDLKEIAAHRADPDGGRAYVTGLFHDCSAMMQAIVASPKPVIAMVDGIATAAGAQLVASCDLAFASTRASFATPGVRTGGFCTTPLVAIGRSIGRKHALEMALSGEAIDAETAWRFGLVNRVVAPEDLAPATYAFAETLASRMTRTVSEGKQTFLAQIEQPLDAAYGEATEVMIRHFLDPGQQEGLARILKT